jgi:hypothetical protein
MYAPVVSAHRDGCHRWHSCPSDSGSYVCGDLGYYSECPGGGPAAVQTQPKVAAPKAPVITKKTVTVDEPIAYKTQTTWTSKEYKGYSKVSQAGVNGTNRVYTEVTYANGKETGRSLIKTEVVSPPADQRITKGKRSKPSAKVTGIQSTKANDKKNITGTYKPNAEVVLALDGKRIKRAKTDDKGKFVFKDIKLPKEKHAIEIFKRVDRKESKISEKYAVNTKKRTAISEYDQLHKKKPAAKPVAKQQASSAAPAPQPKNNCDPNYSGTCVPIANDVDCEGGTGNGPAYAKGPFKVVGSDIYGLDRDGDGTACD